MVVTNGVTMGSAKFEVNPGGTELQLYVLPGTAGAPIWVLVFRTIDLLAPGKAAGFGFTVTVIV